MQSMVSVSPINPISIRPLAEVVAAVQSVTARPPAIQSQPVKTGISPSLRPDLTAAVLSAVTQPSASNRLATMDYLAMRSDLNAGNMAGAQQAYLNMQSDMQLVQSGTASAASVFNVAA
jgi:hypothetical protein